MAGSPKKRARKQRKARAEQRIANLPMVIPQPEEPKDRWGRAGRPSSFRPEYVGQVRILCEEGFTDSEIARHFKVCKDTIYCWQKDYPEFHEAMKLGKGLADDRAERRLYEQAMGYVTTVKKQMKVRLADGSEQLVEATEEVVMPPNMDALKFFLKNRRPDQWKEKTEQHVSGRVEHVELTREQLEERVAARLADLRQRVHNGPVDEAG